MEPRGHRRSRPFTLIELIVVMALLASLLAATAPALARFFRGRSVTEEARRFLALTRYARSQAISRGEPMKLWIDPRAQRYGVAPLHSLNGADDDGLSFRLPEGVTVTVPDAAAAPTGELALVYAPDGMLGSDSPEAFRLVPTRNREDCITIVRAGGSPRFAVAQDDEELDR